MQKKPITLSYRTLWFPLALVLFEFAVYIANDMIQPGMLAVVHEFGVESSWVPTSLTAFLVGGAILPWLMGPLSDSIGRRPVMLGGVVFFIFSCLAIFLSHSIESFIVLRVLQGMGLCFISAVGYATIQEAYEERAAVRVTALMANVALVAPLVGPVAGSIFITLWPWRNTFALIAALASIALVGLLMYMPETVERRQHRLPMAQIMRDYKAVFSNRRFLALAFCIPLLVLPMLGWIALSPVILVEQAGMSTLEYGLWQLPIFTSLMIGNLLLMKYTDAWPLGYSVKLSAIPLLLGVALVVGGAFSAWPEYFLIAGMCFLALSEGLAYAVLYRFALMSSMVAKGTVSASMTMLSMVIYALGVEVLKGVWLLFGMIGLAVLMLLLVMAFWLLSKRMVATFMAERASAAALSTETS